MGRYLATEGGRGACPDWYTLMQVAKYLNVPPWDLTQQPIWWFDRALVAMNAEASAQKQIEARRK